MEAHIKTIWDEKDLDTRNGLKPSVPTIILPCAPIPLVERLNILMASKADGNTGVRNQLVSVCDELLRQNLIDKQKYKITLWQLSNANTKKNLQKEIRYWRAGIFGSIRNIFSRMFSSNAANILRRQLFRRKKLQRKISE